MDVESGWAGQNELVAAQAHPLGLSYFFLGRISSLQSQVNCCRGGRKCPILSPTCLFSYLPPPVPGTKPPFPSIVMKSNSLYVSVKKLSPDQGPLCHAWQMGPLLRGWTRCYQVLCKLAPKLHGCSKSLLLWLASLKSRICRKASFPYPLGYSTLLLLAESSPPPHSSLMLSPLPQFSQTVMNKYHSVNTFV